MASDETSEELIRLRTCINHADMAGWIGVEEALLKWVLYVEKPNAFYYHFQIPKRSGGYRDIAAPFGALKAIQEKIAAKLPLLRRPKHAAHGFVPQKSICTNASSHIRKKLDTTALRGHSAS